MKYKMLALTLALGVMSWAQTATPTPSTPQQTTTADKTKCPCCDKMVADTKDAPACCAHHNQKAAGDKETASCRSGKAAKSCCGGKDATSCMNSDKEKNAASCCSGKDSKSCMRNSKDTSADACCGGKDCEKGCCSAAKKTDANKPEKTAKNCCEDNLRSRNEAGYAFAALGR